MLSEHKCAKVAEILLAFFRDVLCLLRLISVHEKMASQMTLKDK